MKKFLVFLLFVCFLTSCGLFGIKVETGDLGASYRNQASMNPEKICTPYMLEKVWTKLRDGSYYSMHDTWMQKSADKVLKKAMGADVIGNNHDGAFYTWAKIDFVARKIGKSRSELCYAVINGIIKDLKKRDKWASFYDAIKGEKKFGSMIGSDYMGLGFLMRIDYKNKRLFVDYVHKSSAANKGGMKKFDEILTLNGKSMKKFNLKEIPTDFRGKMGSKITLSIKRKGWKKPKTMVFTRELIVHNDARCSMIGDIAYCKVYGFTKKTVKNFSEGFEALPGDPDKVIVDFRNNPGGLLYSATHMLNRMWIKGMTLTVFAKKKYGFVPFGDNTHDKQLFAGKKTVVLTNGNSASATELVVGALKDYSAATLMGGKTYGKGVSQTTHFILGAVLSYTSMYFLSPHGNIIDGNGVKPDIKVKMTLEDFINNNDTQLKAAIKFLKGKK